MDLSMSEQEREAFLSETRIGLLCVEQPERSPLAVPIWYGYSPERGIWISTTTDSLKAKRLNAAGRFTLAVHDEERPHRYVSVEGPITERRPCDAELDIRPLAQRYAPEEQEAYVEATRQTDASIYFMKPETWRTMDQSKLGR